MEPLRPIEGDYPVKGKVKSLAIQGLVSTTFFRGKYMSLEYKSVVCMNLEKNPLETIGYQTKVNVPITGGLCQRTPFLWLLCNERPGLSAHIFVSVQPEPQKPNINEKGF